MGILNSGVAVLLAVLQGQAFVNWESPHVHPIDVTPDGALLLAVNTPDNRLEMFRVSGATLSHVDSVPVGLDPVTVRVRGDDEAWVINHVSDSISIVNLQTRHVRATIQTGDEPADVVFAGAAERAFVSVSQRNEIHVYDPDDLDSAPIVLSVAGEDPRALATDGTRVFTAVFESGNRSTIVADYIVSSGASPYAGSPNPPPNAGRGFDPPIAPDLPAPPAVAQIVKKDAGEAWRDDNGEDWSASIPWDVHDHDVAVVDADALTITYVTGLMTSNMALAATPRGDVVVVGTDGTNEVRFEPNIAGTFVRVLGASFRGDSTVATEIEDLNPHLDYSVASVPQVTRNLSIGDPRGIASNATGDRLYVTGMGSNNLVVLDAALNRLSRTELGSGPTGIAVHPSSGRVFVLNRFEGTVSVVDPQKDLELARVAFFDPTPAAVRAGRVPLYDTHGTSGLGQASCASCHVDARTDHLAWDLGDPRGEMKPLDQECGFGQEGCEDWHPMKGPMVTQTLVGIAGTEPLHWRGDRATLSDFNPAFVSLLGDDEQLDAQRMSDLTEFIASLTPPPNPNRNIDGSLPASMPNGGDPRAGEAMFLAAPLFSPGSLACATCHTLPTGTNGQLIPAALIAHDQSMKVPQLRNMHEKAGFDVASSNNNAGFGFLHAGAEPNLLNFMRSPSFQFGSEQARRDMVAFLLCFSTDTHASIGAQVTIDGLDPDAIASRDQLVEIADSGAVGLVVKGIVSGEARGFAYMGRNLFATDRAAQLASLAALDAVAGPGAEMTYTVVPLGSQTRIGIDRDQDGALDHDELDACADPADAKSFPGAPGELGCCPSDIDGSTVVGFNDLMLLLINWGDCGGCPEGSVGFEDLMMLLNAWGPC